MGQPYSHSSPKLARVSRDPVWDGDLIPQALKRASRLAEASRERVFSGHASQALGRPARIGNTTRQRQNLSVESEPETSARGSVRRHQPPQPFNYGHHDTPTVNRADSALRSRNVCT